MITASCLFALALVAPARLGDCSECKPDDLCGPHRQSEKKGLDEWRGTIRAKDLEQRLSAVRGVAALTKQHANAPSRAVADTLAIALLDDDFRVREAAAEQLADGQHPDAAVKALVRALDDVRAEFAKLGRDRERGSAGASILAKNGKGYADAVIDGLARLPDDRSVDALAGVLKQLGPDAPTELANPLTKALLQLKSRDAIEAVVNRLVSAEGSRGHARGGGAGGGKSGGGPGGGGGSGGGSGGRGGGDKPRPGDRDGDGFRDHAGDEGQRREIHDGLAGLAREKKLDGTPNYDDQVAQKWRDWFEKHVAAFPAKLGRVGSTPLQREEASARH